MARFLCWLIGRRPLTDGHPVTAPQPVTVPEATVPELPARTASRPPCTPGRRPRRRARRPLAGTVLPRSPWNRSADR
ncbi:hypothetical protein ABUL04_23345 [Micromonospora harpali]|uniref:Uncharacterized protein n=1 Tax=Micromonospora harpali TaxID=1490225 RepID=A0ABW1HQH3_9ACTN|nr:hypothetical protein [Micromonospora sp. NBRC 110038]